MELELSLSNYLPRTNT